MRAAVLPEAGKPFVVRDDVELVGPGPGEVRVKVRGSGLCGSDLAMLDSPQLQTPCVLGHESAGVVVEVGAGVTSVAEGDHVIVAFVAPCGACPECLSGQSNICRTDSVRNAQRPLRLRIDGELVPGGAHAEEEVVRAEAAIKIPRDVPLELAALLSCGVTTGVGAALNTARVRPGSSTAVIGCGGIGCNVIQGARIAGAAEIVAVDTVEHRREDARHFGATHAIHPDDLAALTAELTEGAGFDYVFEATNRSDGLDGALAQTRRGGATVIVGLGPFQLKIAAMHIGVMERRILGAYYGSSDVRTEFPRLLKLWRYGRLNLEGLLTRRIDLDDINDGYAAMREGIGIRTMVVFSDV